MNGKYTPFRNIRTLDDLLLAREMITRTSAAVKLPTDPYYPEITVWAHLRCREDELFSPEGQMLIEGTHRAGEGWRLGLTPHGYLRFEGGGGEDALVCESRLPVHAVADAGKEIRLGLSLCNYAWQLRDTQYAAEANAYSRLRLLASSGAQAPFSPIGGLSGWSRPQLAPVPQRLALGGQSRGHKAFAGQIARLVAYNTARVELFDAQQTRRAAQAVPVIPGGGGFAARWVDDETIEVFTRPEFTQTSSYWVFLRLAEAARSATRLRVWTIPHGGVQMAPTFFWSSDRENWRRVCPARVWMAEDGADFRVEFDLRGAMSGRGYLASAPPFLDGERAALLEWAQRQPQTTVEQIGKSVGGRPIHVIRVAREGEAAPTRGVAVVCGQHSPLEIMGGRLIRPIITRLLRHTGLLAARQFHFVPTLNVDCAHYGGNGLNLNLRNTNRHWFDDVQPENATAIGYFDRLRAAGQTIDFAVDVHAGGVFKNHVLMHMEPGDAFAPSKQALAEQEVWRDLLERHAGLRRADGCGLPQLKLRASDYFHQIHGCPAFCLELSTCSYFDPQEQRTRAFGVRAFDCLADGLVKAWEERFCS